MERWIGVPWPIVILMLVTFAGSLTALIVMVCRDVERIRDPKNRLD